MAVLDEIQLISDDQRGSAWTRALLGVSAEQLHICGANEPKGLERDPGRGAKPRCGFHAGSYESPRNYTPEKNDPIL